MVIEPLVVLLGLVAGSFLNVCIHRLPRSESVIRPRSYCPNCGHSVAWFDNLPILSFFILRGLCRHCKVRISIRYPLVELASGLLWWGCWRAYGLAPIFGLSVGFISVLLVVSVTDIETGLIPDQATFSGLVAGVVASFLWPALQVEGFVEEQAFQLVALLESVGGLVLGGGLIYVTGLVGNWVFRKESMGGGDVKLLAMIGCFVGWQKVLLTFFMAPMLALPFALYQRWVKKQETIGYGPFLALAGGIQFFWGDLVWRYVMNR